MDKFDSSTPLNKAFNGSKKTIYSKDLAFRAAKVTIVLKTGAQVLGFLVTILLVKILSEQEYGAYNTFISSISVIGSIFSLGIGNTLQRYIPKYIKNEEFILAKKIVHYAFFARFISLCIICLFGYIYRMEIATWMNISEYIAAVVPFIFVVILHFQSRLLGSILIACLFQGVNQSAQITLVLTKVVLYMYLSINNVDLVAILIADLVAYGFMMIVIILGYVKYIKPLNGGRKIFDQEERKDILKYAAFNNLNDVGLVSLGRDIDVIFLASMVDVISAGAYAFANRISHTLKQISPVSYFIDIIRPLFFTLDATNEKDKINLYFNLLLKLNYLFELPMMCGLYVMYPYVIEYVFDGKYVEYRLLSTLAFSIVAVTSFGMYVGLVAQLKLRADIIFYSKLFAIINVVGNLILIPMYGVYGAIVSTMISILGKDLFVFYFVKKDISIKPFLRFFIASITYWATIGIVSDFIVEKIGLSLLSGALGATFCLLSYLLFIQFNIFTHGEIKAINNISKNNGNKLKIIGL